MLTFSRRYCFVVLVPWSWKYDAAELFSLFLLSEMTIEISDDDSNLHCSDYWYSLSDDYDVLIRTYYWPLWYVVVNSLFLTYDYILIIYFIFCVFIVERLKAIDCSVWCSILLLLLFWWNIIRWYSCGIGLNTVTILHYYPFYFNKLCNLNDKYWLKWPVLFSMAEAIRLNALFRLWLYLMTIITEAEKQWRDSCMLRPATEISLWSWHGWLRLRRLTPTEIRDTAQLWLRERPDVVGWLCGSAESPYTQWQ